MRSAPRRRPWARCGRSGATGDWAGWDLNVALWTDGTWLRLPPRTGWRAWVEDAGLLLVYDGAGWVGTTPAALQNLALLGLGTTADASNPFSAKLNAALWTAKTVAEGGTGDLFYTMNKEAAGDDLGLTLQTGFVTKALVGLFGSDRFRLAVSTDGSTFFDGLSVDNATGIVDQPRLPRFKAYTNYDNYVGVGSWRRWPSREPAARDTGPRRGWSIPRSFPGTDRPCRLSCHFFAGGVVSIGLRERGDLLSPEGDQSPTSMRGSSLVLDRQGPQ
ncbi:DUF2793 domain-containing protein [Rhodovulum sulfidophilum]|uniref:DUF2793 domain-containing protein n=1 Tax=Rhodovulum sulfidophilum TaxID=35806 RepID=UPI00387322E3